MRCIIYRSKADRSVKAEDITRITAVSRRQNPVHGVTGVLLYDGRCFVQVIEGPALSIDNLIRNIEADVRHMDIERLLDSEVSVRSFEKWSMEYVYGDLRQSLEDLPAGSEGLAALRQIIERADIM